MQQWIREQRASHPKFDAVYKGTLRRKVRGVGARGAGRAWDARREAQGVRREGAGARSCVCVCLYVCVGLFVRGLGGARQGGGERRAASASSATKRGDVVTYTAAAL